VALTLQTFAIKAQSVDHVPTDPIPEQVLQRRRAIGVQIREARERAKFTQERLAERADLDRVTVVRIETGVASARLDHLLMIANALGVPLSHLVRD
jgi:DNA-binding XRE family transcriptional regulator